MLKQAIIYSFILVIVMALPLSHSCAQDSMRILKKITVRALKQKNTFTATLPSQSLNKEILQQINAPSVGDAARFFSGVQLKDYGGTGGLKTVSVRSLGAAQTGILYDGIAVSDAQSGQVDLSRYSSTFIQSVDVYLANLPGILLPARAFSSASVLSINTQSSVYEKPTPWQAGIRYGSFGYLNALAGAGFLLPSNMMIRANIEAVSSNGDYPFTIDNGNIRDKTRRNNGAIRSLQAELNLSKIFNDSSSLEMKGWTYDSKRGLPGAIIFFNERSVQQLGNADYFVQGRYKKTFYSATSLQVLGKFNHTSTRYTDPDFLNNSGGLDDRYQQNETYFSAAVNQKIGQFILLDFASDIAYAGLQANTPRFASPSRISHWSNFQINYVDSLWQWNASVLWNRFSDHTNVGDETRNKFTPTVALSRKLSRYSPLLLRAFYKQVFRMPTFNDLYYNFIGNSKLRPEYAQQYNVGISYAKRINEKIREVNVSVDAYYNTVKDKIIAVPGQNLFSWTMLNLGRVEVKGIDLTAEVAGTIHPQLNWFFRVAYTLQQARDMTDRNSSNYGDRIPYTPDHSGSGIFTLRYKNWAGGYSLGFSGTRYTLGENNSFNQLEGWGVQDAFVSRIVRVKIFKMTVKGEINNIGNTHYDVIRYYPMPGRSGKISLLFSNS